ncbi:MAG: hypothetical protein M0Q14_08470 [Tissierellaceae bacterium]|nr:hypothetical protein [Tissierellaceae bacterium]
MAKIYASLIIAGKKLFSQVPEQIKEDVKNTLKDEVANGKITPELFQELVGEAYIME